MEVTGFDTWALSLAVFLPVVGALVIMLIPKAYETELKLVALGSSLIALVVGAYIAIQFDYGAAGDLQFVVDKGWIDVINSRYIVGLDGLSLPLLLLSLVVVPLCLIYSWNHIPEPGNPKAFFVLLLILSTGMNGSFIAQDMILFFVFFEIVLLIRIAGIPGIRFIDLIFTPLPLLLQNSTHLHVMCEFRVLPLG